MNWFVALWLAFQSSPVEVHALQQGALACLSPSSAAQQLGAARIAGEHYGVDPLMLLAVALGCDSQGASSLLGGYLDEAARLRRELDACHAADRWRHALEDEVVRRCALRQDVRARRRGAPVGELETRVRRIRWALGIPR